MLALQGPQELAKSGQDTIGSGEIHMRERGDNGDQERRDYVRV